MCHTHKPSNEDMFQNRPSIWKSQHAAIVLTLQQYYLISASLNKISIKYKPVKGFSWRVGRGMLNSSNTDFGLLSFSSLILSFLSSSRSRSLLPSDQAEKLKQWNKNYTNHIGIVRPHNLTWELDLIIYYKYDKTGVVLSQKLHFTDSFIKWWSMWHHTCILWY